MSHVLSTTSKFWNTFKALYWRTHQWVHKWFSSITRIIHWILMILYLMVMCCSLHFVVFWNPPVLYRMLRGSSHVGDAEKSLPFTAFLCVCLHSLCLAHNDSCTKFITSSALQLFGKDCLTKQDKTTPSFTDFVSSQRVLSHLTPFKLEC